jgi:hypothetical protein
MLKNYISWGLRVQVVGAGVPCRLAPMHYFQASGRCDNPWDPLRATNYIVVFATRKSISSLQTRFPHLFSLRTTKDDHTRSYLR